MASSESGDDEPLPGDNIDQSNVPDSVPDAVLESDVDPTNLPGVDPEGYPRRWALVRLEDASGVSGTGVVAWGIEFPDGLCVYRWTTKPRTTQVAPTPQAIWKIHGHGGKTELRWVDE